MATSKKRGYLESYLDFGFTSIEDNGVIKPQCVLCLKVLAAESLKPSKLKAHLESKHPGCIDKDRQFFETKLEGVKKQRLDASGTFRQQTEAAVEASYIVSYQIAKCQKPHTIGEQLVLPCAKEMVRLLVGEKFVQKVENVSLSNDTVKRRISDMSEDIKEQVISEIKSAGLFSIQLDESTDVQSCSQLLVFARYVCDNTDFKEEFLFCKDIELSTKGVDVFRDVSNYFESEGLDWNQLCGVCTDGAPAMLGSRSGFVTLLKTKSPQATSVHCMIHRQALASRTLPPSLNLTLDAVIKTVNYIKKSALNTRLFRKLCNDMDADHENLLFHTNVRWLSRGNVVRRVFALKNELRKFLEAQSRDDLLAAWNNAQWDINLAYLVDIFGQFNTLNLSLQGKDTLVIDFVDKIKAFIRRLDNWKRKVAMGNVAMFETVSDVLDERELSHESRDVICEHLQSLEDEFKLYFPEISNETVWLVRDPFTAPISSISDDNDVAQTELMELQEDSTAKICFRTKSLTQFWCIMKERAPNVADIVLRVLLPFASTYRCEQGFSTLMNIKTKNRNRLNVQDDLRCVLSSTQPRIRQLVAKKQCQPSH